MYIALYKEQKRISIRDAVQGDTFFCPVCLEKMFVLYQQTILKVQRLPQGVCLAVNDHGALRFHMQHKITLGICHDDDRADQLEYDNNESGNETDILVIYQYCFYIQEQIACR